MHDPSEILQPPSIAAVYTIPPSVPPRSLNHFRMFFPEVDVRSSAIQRNRIEQQCSMSPKFWGFIRLWFRSFSLSQCETSKAEIGGERRMLLANSSVWRKAHRLTELSSCTHVMMGGKLHGTILWLAQPFAISSAASSLA
jgi:hypothetical protein